MSFLLPSLTFSLPAVSPASVKGTVGFADCSSSPTLRQIFVCSSLQSSPLPTYPLTSTLPAFKHSPMKGIKGLEKISPASLYSFAFCHVKVQQEDPHHTSNAITLTLDFPGPRTVRKVCHYELPNPEYVVIAAYWTKTAILHVSSILKTPLRRTQA